MAFRFRGKQALGIWGAFKRAFDIIDLQGHDEIS
jgi:hypothetical protein